MNVVEELLQDLHIAQLAGFEKVTVNVNSFKILLTNFINLTDRISTLEQEIGQIKERNKKNGL